MPLDWASTHDAYLLRAETELMLACVFIASPAGWEVHDATGAYALNSEAT
ncbi:ectoine synthase [Mesorhizobium sp. ORM16]